MSTQMVLDSESVAKIAALARLQSNPSSEFTQKYAAELGAVLEYIEQLKEVDVTGVDPMDGSRTIGLSELRSDDTWEDQVEYQEVRLAILENFPNRQGDLLVIPGIFEND